MPCPKAILFDLDETLAESFQAPDPEILKSLAKLAAIRPVAIISGAGFARIELDVLDHLTNPGRLYIFPNSSTQCYVNKDGIWEQMYNLALSVDDRLRIKMALEDVLEDVPVAKEAPHFGQQIIDREAQVAFTVVGLDAPQEVKMQWDADRAKRKAIIEYLQKKIPDFDILIGGASTIDVTHKDINKAYGVRWLAERLGIAPSDMYYVGDALYPGGNDFVVIETGIKTRSTTGPQETLGIIDGLLAACST